MYISSANYAPYWLFCEKMVRVTSVSLQLVLTIDPNYTVTGISQDLGVPFALESC